MREGGGRYTETGVLSISNNSTLLGERGVVNALLYMGVSHTIQRLMRRGRLCESTPHLKERDGGGGEGGGILQETHTEPEPKGTLRDEEGPGHAAAQLRPEEDTVRKA